MSKKILAVDDSPSVRKLLEFTLQSGGFLATTAKDGQEAWDIIVSEIFDAAILDINMPRLNGFELLGRIRGHENLKTMPVIMLVSEENETDRELASKLGATAYLAKSFKPTMLLELINRILKAQ